MQLHSVSYPAVFVGKKKTSGRGASEEMGEGAFEADVLKTANWEIGLALPLKMQDAGLPFHSWMLTLIASL